MTVVKGMHTNYGGVSGLGHTDEARGSLEFQIAIKKNIKRLIILFTGTCFSTSMKL